MNTTLCIAALIALVSLAVAPPAAAVPLDPDPDGVGVYFDETATVNCMSDPPLFTYVPAYLVATNISEGSGIGAWALNLEATPTVIPPSVLPLGCAIMIPELGDILCGVTPPHPWAAAIVLAEVRVMLTAPDETVLFTIGPTTPDYVPGHPAYSPGDDPSRILPLFPSAGRDATGAWRPVAVLNGPCDVVGVEGRTWGALKSLYR